MAVMDACRKYYNAYKQYNRKRKYKEVVEVHSLSTIIFFFECQRN